MIDGKSILVTGGTGSFGKAFVATLLEKYSPKKIIIYSRDELKQFEMQQVFSPIDYPCLRYFIGDIRDGQRLKRACEGVDIIIHAAALKQVPAAENNPMECIYTNIHGAENVINAALDSGVNKVVALSTDKAAAPINLYGATKLCSDKLFIAANNMRGNRDLAFSVVRYGNVLGSRGSVVPFFLKQKSSGVLSITDKSMTRFNITLEEGVNLVINAIKNSWGGELYVPKIPSYRIMDVANAVSPFAEKKIVGIRSGEKLHEEMITSTDSLNTFDCGSYYVILPASPVFCVEKFKSKFNCHKVEPGFNYSSENNSDWLSIDEMRNLITMHVDSSFSVEI